MEDLTKSQEGVMLAVFFLAMMGMMMLVCYSVYKDAQEEMKNNK